MDSEEKHQGRAGRVLIPPPLPGEESPKRILPALVLCVVIGFLGAHRVYAGRFISGLAQLALSLASGWWLKQACAGLLELRTLEEAMEWSANNQPPLAPLLFFLATGIWISIDCVRIAAGSFADGHGRKISRWI